MSQRTIAAALTAAALTITACAAVTLRAATPAYAAATGCPVVSARLGLHWPYSHLPENSLGAIDAAHRAGAPKTVIDVQFSGNGVPVVIHNSTVDRMTAHTGRVSAYTAAQLEAMTLRLYPGSATMTVQHLPSLFAVLARAKADGMTVSIEIKPDVLTYAQARAVLYRMWWTGTEGGVDVRSYDRSVLAEMRKAGYWGRLTLTVDAAQPLPPGAYWMESADYLFDGIYVTAADVTMLHAARIRVDVYTPDTAAQFVTVPAGVDQVTTDNVAGWRAFSGC